MARLPRFVLAGHPQHVIVRGNNREPIFNADEDYRFYLERPEQACDKHDCDLHAYVLMTNHVHLLITPNRDDSLSKQIDRVWPLRFDVEEKLRSIWSPAPIPVNEVGRLDVKDQVLRILADGNVEHELNLAGTLGAHFDLRRFPFDRQTLPIKVESFTGSVDALRLVPNEERMGFAADFTLPEWHLLEMGSHVDEVETIRSLRPFSRLVVELEIDRKTGFYLWKVLLPLLVIVALSWSVFWMGEERFASRTRMTATGVLTIVAYQFVVGDGLPRIAYLTLLDKVMILSFGLLAVTVLESLWVSRYQDEDPERARRIDRGARWAFPLFYASLLVFVFLDSG